MVLLKQKGSSCQSRLTLTFNDGETTVIDACVQWNIEPKFDFDPDDPPALTSFELELNGTNDAGFECQVQIIQEDICGIGYFDLQDVTSSTYAITTDCSGVSGNNESEFSSIDGYPPYRYD